MVNGNIRWISDPLVAVALVVSLATSAIADVGGIADTNSCGGIGEAKTAPHEGYDFPCDNVGRRHASPKAGCPGQGFSPRCEKE
jgi:hypothetical protein